MPSVNIDVWNPGRDLTAHAATTVTASTCASLAGPMIGGLPQITTAAPGARIAGICKYSATTGELVGLARGAARVVRVRAGAPLSAGVEVEVGAAGAVVPKSTGVAVGYALDTAASGALAVISLY